jgi:tRNA G18 (ribose-2'-O)-methylase SpoU
LPPDFSIRNPAEDSELFLGKRNITTYHKLYHIRRLRKRPLFQFHRIPPGVKFMIASIADIDTTDHPGLEPYNTLRRWAEHDRLGIFVAEGNKVVLRLIASSLTIDSILLTDEWFTRCREALEQRPEPVAVYRGTARLVKSIVGFNYHQGIMAVARVPGSATIASVCAAAPAPRLFVALDHISNTENAGVIIRNCAACGATALISGETSVDPYLRRSVRNSMGAIFKLPVIYSGNLAATLNELRCNYGFSTIAAHVRPQSISMHQADFTRDCCIVFGNEQSGVSEEIAAQCDTLAIIPMHPGVDSFNVGCASAIMLYEALRQRSTPTE